MDIHLFYKRGGRNQRQISEAIHITNQVQNQYKLIDMSERWEKFIIPEVVFFEDLAWLKNYHDEKDYCIYIISSRFADNWFSHESYNFSIITTHSWTKYFAPPSLKAYLIYQFAQSFITFSSDLDEEDSLSEMVHNPSIGCINDMCINKADIKIGISAGYICPACRTKYLQFGVTENKLRAIEAVLSVSRAEAIAKPLHEQIMIPADEKRIFIVHGHNEKILNLVADYVKGIGLEPIILKRLARPGIDSILNQISNNANVMCALLLFTADDEGNEIGADTRKRARQNVVFEAGYFVGKLGKEKVLMMAENDIELPSDLTGCRYIDIDKEDIWKTELYTDLVQMGLTVK